MKKLIKGITAVLLALSITFMGACNPDTSTINAAYYYCVNKLENADLSFNFASNAKSATSQTSLASQTTSSTYTVNEGSYYYDEGVQTYFGWQTLELTDIASQARMRIDELTQCVTVLNKLVVFNGVTARYSGYDEENDVVTGFIGYLNNDYIQDKDEGIDSGITMEGQFGTGGGDYVDPNTLLPKDTLTGALYIKIYEEDGVEVVEFSTFDYTAVSYSDNTKGAYNYCYVKYAPLKEYIVERSQLFTNAYSLDVLENQGTSRIFKAIKQNGKFIGFKAEFDYSNPTNSLISGETFMETGDGFFTLDLVDEATRYFNTGYHYIELSDSVYSSNSQYLSLLATGGWNKIVYNITDLNGDNVVDNTDYYLTIQNSFYLYYKDYVLLDNGKKITEGTLWSQEDGFIAYELIDFVGGVYTFEDGTTLSEDEFKEYANNAAYEFLRISEIHVNPFYNGTDTGLIVSAGMTVSLYDPTSSGGGVSGGGVSTTTSDSEGSGSQEGNNQPKEAFIDVFKAFMIENDLTFNGNDANEIFAYNEASKENRLQILKNVFDSVLGYDYNAQGITNLKNSIVTNTKNLVSNCRTIYSTYERMLRKNMPKLEDGAGLMQLENAAKGNFSIKNDKFDFSGVTVTIPKHALLEDGATYGVKVFLQGHNSIEIEGAFNTFTYAKKEVTITGNANVEIPVFTEGEYVIWVVVGKIKNGNFMEVSSLIMMEADYFGTYEITATIDENEYVITYESVENQRFMATSVLKSN